MPERLTGTVLVTGGAGFIGSHLAQSLARDGISVRVADVVPKPDILNDIEYFCGNLCDITFCHRVVKDVKTVFHLAANMGGMGTIHSENDFQIFRENNTMTLNMFDASAAAGVDLFVFASSACVYPDHLQQDATETVRLRESDVWSQPPPKTQGLYGLEKLVGELIAHNARVGTMKIRIARFHNVYGPGGTWHGGREKAPAAFARKALATRLLEKEPIFEMWGDGKQKRSFLYIDDCVDAIRLLLTTDVSEPLNIGSDESVTMSALARIACDVAGLEPSSITFNYRPDRPVGVVARSSDNTLVSSALGWNPTIGLEEGMRRTVEWIKEQMKDASTAQLEVWTTSEVINLKNTPITFAILLPITSHGSTNCLANLERFAQSLYNTTWRDLRETGIRRYHLRIYLVIDKSDIILQSGKAEEILVNHGFLDICTMIRDYPRGSVCALWRDAASEAWNDRADYFLLLGDDIELLDEGWMRDIDIAFQAENPPGFGCRAFTDVTFPGMPTFPVVHRTHMNIFDGKVIPDDFINQDGDPFLFQLYRRFGASTMLPLRIRNNVGGSQAPRYERKHLARWTFEVLDKATDTVQAWLRQRDVDRRLLTLDVIVPSYRVPLESLEYVLSLKSSPTCSVMFIVIIDDPSSQNIALLKQRHGHRVDVRIRANRTNAGASRTRNHGLEESAAEWVHFLDDDVEPNDDILIEAERVIRDHPDVAGFVGTVRFPPANTIFKSAVHLAGVTWFWDVAEKMSDHHDIPWGVTASLIARRNRYDIMFDPRYPKTGGGEDIDFCIHKRDIFVQNNLGGFFPAPSVIATHPWWDNGNRCYNRFHKWAIGDGQLVAAFPQHTYLNYYPTSAEHIAILFCISSAYCLVGYGNGLVVSVKALALALLANIIHDLLNHLVVQRTVDPRSTISRYEWPIAILESVFIRIWSEAGRLRGQISRGELTFSSYGRRFDWFLGRVGDGPIRHERGLSARRFWLWILLCVAVYSGK